MWLWFALGAVAVVIAFVVFAARQQQAFEARIRRDGREARGWIVAAPPDLCQDGNSLSGAAHVVFTFDAGVGKSDAVFKDWVERVKRYKAPPKASEDEKWLEECVRTAFATSKLVRLPTEVSGSAEGYFTSVIIKRALLPEGKITRPYILFRVVTGEGGGTVMVEYPDATAAK